MAFVRTAYDNLQQHCRDLIEGQSLQNDIYFLAASSKEVRVTFGTTLTQGQRDAFEASGCFQRFITHADRDAVILDRWDD